jgi:hypothetical protein
MTTPETTTTGTGETAARYSIEFGKIAALQNITSPSGEKFCAIYENENSFLFCGERSQRDLSALLPEKVKQCALERFRFVFALPCDQRGEAIATLPVSLI